MITKEMAKAKELYEKHYSFIGNKEAAIHCSCITAREVLRIYENINNSKKIFWMEVLIELNLME